MAFLSLDNVTFAYPAGEGKVQQPVVRNLSLTVEAGEFVALVGANGSGKSTVAKLCNGMEKPTAGQVIVDGLCTADEKNTFEIRRRVGLVLQNPDNQLVASVVEEDVAFGPENLGVPPAEIRRRVDAALKAVGLYEERHRGPHQLSGGQKQRAAIAGILAMEPKCIVLDEPTAMLDPRGRREVLGALRYLHREKGITVILITHYMEEAALADRMVVLDDGQAVLSGTPRQVFSQVDTLRRYRLDVPQAAELAWILRQRGVALPDGILTVEECAHALEQARKGGRI